LGGITPNAAADMVTKVTPFMMLSSPSMFLVQGTQPYVFAVPALSTRHGVHASAIAISKHYLRQISKTGGDYTYSNGRMETQRDRAHAIVDAEAIGNTAEATRLWGEAITDEQRMLLGLSVAAARGSINITLTHEANELIQKGHQSKSTNLLNKSMFFMQASELASRKATFAASFEMEYAKQRGEGKSEAAAAEAAAKYGVKIVNDNLFDYATSNKPVILRSVFGRIFMPFRIFQFHSMFKVGNLLMQAIGTGDYTQAQRSQARQEFAALCYTSGLLSGAAGMPLLMPTLQLLSVALNLVGDPDDPWDLDNDLRKWLVRQGTIGVFAAKGLPTVLGFDLSNRIGIPLDMVQGEPPASYTARQRYTWYVMKQAGALVGGVGQNLYAAPEMFEKQGVAAGLATLLPRGVGDFAKAYQATYGEGIKSASGKVIIPPDQVSIYEGVLMFLGFNPTQMSLGREGERDKGQISQEISKRKGDISRHFVKSILTDNAELKEKTIEEVKAFSVAHPAFAFKASELISAVRTAKMEAMGIDTKREMKIKAFEMPQEGSPGTEEAPPEEE
jgi:hypothetical protein